MSSFVVSARKYRPQRFEDVVGQEHISETLKNALSSDHLAHAFLFCGPRGVGKTTCARILAKTINCQDLSSDFEPCGKCHSCKSFNENTSFNILELDAASNNGVEHIRELVNQVRFPPQNGRYKVFIIDEVHMLSQSAFNAFLKTLEEPPAHAIFILATTEKHKILPTILSRCQIYDFNRIGVDNIVSHLQQICSIEKINADETGLHVIGEKADGALRDALSIFDRIVSASKDRTITYQQVIKSLNVLDYSYYFKFVDYINDSNVEDVLLDFDTVIKSGFDEVHFITGLANHFRNLLIAKSEKTVPLMQVAKDTQLKYLQQAQQTSKSTILTALSLASACDVNYKMARNKRLHVETALIKMCFIQHAIHLTTDSDTSVAKKKLNNSTTTSSSPSVSKVAKETNTISVEIPKIEKVEREVDLPEIKQTVKPYIEIAKQSLAQSTSLLASIEQKVEVEEEAQKLKVSLLNEENLFNAWSKYIDTINSPIIKEHFTGSKIALNGQLMTIRSPRKLSQNAIKSEQNLLPLLRQQLQDQNLRIEVVVDESLIPESEKIITIKKTAIEIYQDMIKVNPLLEKLVLTLNLKPSTL